MIWSYHRYILPLILILIYSCSGSQETSHEISNIPVKEIKEKVNRNYKLIESLSASGSVAFDSPEMSNSGSIEVRIRKPDTVYVKVEGPFGIDIAEALITRTGFIYYNAQENRAITGPTTENNIDAILRVSVNFDELINSLSGSFYFKENSEDSLNAGSEDNSYVLQVTGENMKKKYFISPNMFVINKYGVFDNNNHSEFEVTYSKFKIETVDSDTIYFPNQIEIHRPDKKQTLWLYYDDKEINKKKLVFHIKIPSSAKLIKWEK
jgi:hypothetical protein